MATIASSNTNSPIKLLLPLAWLFALTTLSAVPVTVSQVPDLPYTYGLNNGLPQDAVAQVANSSLVDYDLDGDLDIFFIYYTGGITTAEETISLYRNGDSAGGPAGTFNKVLDSIPLPFTEFWGTGEEYSDWADMDLDGDEDLILSLRIRDSGSVQNVALLYRNEAIQGSPGEFTLLNIFTTGYQTKNVWGNFNSGNYPDLIIGNTLWSNNNGTGAFILTSVTIANLNSEAVIRVFDVDKDGFDDVVRTHTQLFVEINELDTAGAFIVDSTLANSTTSTFVNDTWGDVDGDGDLDVVYVSFSNGRRPTLLRNGDAFGANSGTFTPGFIGAQALQRSGEHYPVLIDFDNDNDLDIVVTNGVYEFKNGFFNPEKLIPQASFYPSGGGASIADLNGDGFDDFGSAGKYYFNTPQFSAEVSYDDRALVEEAVRMKVTISPTENRPGLDDDDFSIQVVGQAGLSYFAGGSGRTYTVSFMTASQPASYANPRLVIQSGTGARTDIIVPFTTVASAGSSFIQRHYSQSYVPDVAQTVVLLANPGNISSYSIAEKIPFEWEVDYFSTGGVYLKNQNTLNFGPYFDSSPRTLVYTIRPAVNTSGFFLIGGTGSADGLRSVVRDYGNFSRPNTSVPYYFYDAITHPADVNPRDQILSIDEVTNYARAWALGLEWPIDPNPINQDFVTRAAYIWRNGLQYFQDRYIPYSEFSAPLWWETYSLPDTDGEGTQPVYFDFSGELPIGTFTADSSFSTDTLSTTPFEVIITTNMTGSVTNHAILEKLPQGWIASNINNGGSFSALNNTITWGPYFDGSNRTLIYTAIPPSGGVLGHVAFIGALSIDGASTPIKGTRELGSFSNEQLSLGSASEVFDGKFALSSVDVTAQQGVRWSAFSLDPWIQVQPESTEGTGSGKVFFSLSKNETGSNRVGQVNIGGKLFSVTQNPLVSPGALKVNDWNLTDIGYVYGYTETWGYSIFMGSVYMDSYPWIYQIPFDWIYHISSFPNIPTGTNLWFYNSTLGNIFVSDGEGGWFRAQNTGWAWDNFLNPL